MIEGLVEPIEFTTLACPGNVDGIVTFLIDNGTHVNEGDVVCIIEDNNQQNNHDNLEISLENAVAELSKVNARYGVGLTITIPILDWGENRALVRASESRLKQYNYRKEEVEREIETEVKNLIASINSNLKRLQVLEKNVSVAEKSFDITRQRFSDGDIDSQGLALERNRLNNAYTSHLRAYINYQLSLADLTRKTFYDFQSREEVK